MKKLITTLTFLMVAVFAFSQSEYRKMYGKYEYNNNVKFLDSLFLPNLPGAGNNVILDTNTGLLVIDSATTVKNFESGQNLDLITSPTLVKYLLNDTIDSLAGVITDSLKVKRDAVYFDTLSGTGDNLKIDTATGKVYRGLSGSPLTFQSGSNLSVTNISDVVTYSLNNDVTLSGDLTVNGTGVAFPNIPTLETSQILYVDLSGNVSVGDKPGAGNRFYRTYTNSVTTTIDRTGFGADHVVLFGRNSVGEEISFNEKQTFTADATVQLFIDDIVADIPAHGCNVTGYITIFRETESENSTPVGPYLNLSESQTRNSIRPPFDGVDVDDNLVVNNPEPFYKSFSMRTGKFSFDGNPYLGVILNTSGCGGADINATQVILRIRRTSNYDDANENAVDNQ